MTHPAITTAEAFIRVLKFNADRACPERVAGAAQALRVEIDAIIGSPALPEPPAGAWTHCGKQLFRDGVHAGDAATVELAAEIVRALNSTGDENVALCSKRTNARG